MTDEANPDQYNQLKQWPHTEIKEANAPVLSGTFEAPVTIKYYPERQEPFIPSLPFVYDPPSDFTGRDGELRELQAKFEAGKNIIGLRGIGGVGKTALALKLVESLKDRYPDGQIMVDMKGTTDPKSPMEAMGDVIHAYQPEEKLPDSEAKVEEMYRRVLNGKRALILLDNALDDKQVLKLIPPISCGLIITSRRTIKIPGLFKKDLDVLKPDEAVHLLLNVCCFGAGPQISVREDPAWPEIARLCGYLPLALRAAASYLANSEDISPARYASDLKDEQNRLEKIGEQGVEMSVNASFSLSFQKLEPKLRQTFLNLSVFPGDFDSQAEEQICQDHGHEGLSELLRWSLVEYRWLVAEAEGRYHLHDLVRLFAASLQEQDKDLKGRHARYYQERLQKANNLLLQGGDSMKKGLQLFDLEWLNIQGGQSWTKENADMDSEAAGICSNFARTGSILELRLHPQENVKWLLAALSAARRIKSKEAKGAHLGNLGMAYINLGKHRKAIKFTKQALAIAREIGDKKTEGIWLGNLGLAYFYLDEPRKAIELYQQALAIAKEIVNPKGEGNALGNLGLAYANLDEPRKAIEFYEKALAIARKIEDKNKEGIWLGNLGIVHSDLGDPRKAIEFYQQALAIAKEIVDRRSEGNALGNLGRDYFNLGDSKKAIEFYEKALAIAREIEDKNKEGIWLDNLGQAYAKLGDPRKAIEYYEQQLVITREIGDRRGEANALFDSSLALFELGKHSIAIENAEGALQICEQIESPYADRVKQKLAEWRR